MAVFKYTAVTVYEQQSVPVPRESFAESSTGNDAPFALLFNEWIPIVGCAIQEGEEQKGQSGQWPLLSPITGVLYLRKGKRF